MVLLINNVTSYKILVNMTRSLVTFSKCLYKHGYLSPVTRKLDKQEQWCQREILSYNYLQHTYRLLTL